MKFLLADLNKENEKYLRKDIDGGILSEKYEIDRYKYQQYNDVVDNLMLGNYNEFGEYIIQDEIKEELINCRKVIEDNYENILFIKSEEKVNVFSFLNFAVKVVDSDKLGYKAAILELLEPIYKTKGYIENTQATVIKKIVLPNNDVFKDEVYKAFNIIVDNSNGKKYINDMDEFSNILDRKIRLLYVKKHISMQDDFMMCYKKNVEELEKTDEGKKVLEEYKKEEEVAKKYLNVDEDDYKSKNELLTTNMEKKFKVLPKEISKNILELEMKKAMIITELMISIEESLLNESKNRTLIRNAQKTKKNTNNKKLLNKKQKSYKRKMEDENLVM